MKTRVKPPRCATCGTDPTECPTCGDYQCMCPVPWFSGASKKQQKRLSWPRAHYRPDGKPYLANFIDDYEHLNYPDRANETQWLIEGGFS